MDVLEAIKSDDWIPYERNGEMEFHTAIRSKRLRRWLGDVWESLPLADRHKIGDVLVLVSDDSILRFILADVQYGDGYLYGCAVPLEDGRRFIFLNASTLRRKPAAFCRYLISHELAHVFHIHSGGRSAQHEAEADATAARWGYPNPEPDDVKVLEIKRVEEMPA
jgi:hypothetical protein